MNDNTVSQQWANRPDDQRFLSLDELFTSVKNRADKSKVAITNNKEIRAYGTEEGAIVLNTKLGPKFFSHWSFGQTAAAAQAPAAYLRRLPSPLAAACLNNGLDSAKREESAIMVNGNDTLRCLTSSTYGRIWDHQVVQAVRKVTDGGPWKVPSASYASSNPKRATTLYASDRDVFIFLVDEDHPVEVNGETLFRGFYTWNSEVGAQTFGLACFLYRTVCDNRIIWGIQNKEEIRIRHTSGAPERFAMEGKKALLEYSKQSAKPLIEQIKRAQNIKVGKDEDEVKDFLKKFGLTAASATSVIQAAKAEENDFYTPWSLAQGMTANARSIVHTDARVEMERQAGKLLNSILK